jgi:peptide/nickel transport system substrate-binding protein
VTFQDGTSFTAQAVQSSIERDLDPRNSCACEADFAAVHSITTSDDHTLVLHLSSPDYALVDAWADDEAPNWTVSPTALAKEG